MNDTTTTTPKRKADTFDYVQPNTHESMGIQIPDGYYATPGGLCRNMTPEEKSIVNEARDKKKKFIADELKKLCQRRQNTNL